METICLMRDIYRAIQTFEADFQKVHRVCMNEAMLLCSLEPVAHVEGNPFGRGEGVRQARTRRAGQAQNVFRTDGGRKEMPCGDEVRQRGGARDPAAGVPGPVRRPGIRRV